MAMAAFGLVGLLVLLFALAGVAGLVLFVAGVVARKPGMWVAGLCIFLVLLIGGVFAGAAAFWYVRTEVTYASYDPGIGGSSKVSQERVRELFRTELGRALPPQVEIAHADEVTTFGLTTTYYIQLRAGTDFGDWLKETGFEQFHTARTGFSLPQGWERHVPWWDASAAAADRTYSKATGSVDEGGFEFRVGHNTQTGVVYVVAEEYRP